MGKHLLTVHHLSNRVIKTQNSALIVPKVIKVAAHIQTQKASERLNLLHRALSSAYVEAQTPVTDCPVPVP